MTQSDILSRRELALLRLRMTGATLPECAEELGVSPRAAQMILDHCKEKLQARSEAHAIALAIAKKVIAVRTP